MEAQNTQPTNNLVYTAQSSGYGEGNGEAWLYAISSYLPRSQEILRKTIDPFVHATLIQLLGNSEKFHKHSLNLIPVLNDLHMITHFAVAMKFMVPDFVGVNIDNGAIAADTRFILVKLQTGLPAFKWTDKSISIDLAEGSIEIKTMLMVGI